MNGSDYLQSGFVFCQPCRYGCGNRIEWTRELGQPADFFCSDHCRERARAGKVANLRRYTKEALIKFLADHEAVIEFEAYNDGTAGASLKVSGQDVAQFDGCISGVSA